MLSLTMIETVRSIQTEIKNFIKDESSHADPKKMLELTLVGTLATSFSPEKLQADNSVRQMTPITTAEDFYPGNWWNQSIISDYLDLIHPELKEKYYYSGMPNYIGLPNDASLKENLDRYNFYGIKRGFQFVISGLIYNIPFTDTEGLKLIPEGIKTTKQWASFILKSDKENFYTLGITGVSDELKGKNFNVNIIVFQNQINCNGQDQLRTTTLKSAAYKYPMGALGKSIRLEKDRTIEQNFNLNIPKSIQKKCTVVAFLQGNKEIVAAACCDLIEGNKALFSFDDLSKNTIDNTEDINKYNSLNDLGLKLQNSFEYQDKVGYKEKIFGVRGEVTDLKSISYQLDYTSSEAQIYHVLAAALNPKLKDKATIKYDPNKQKVDIVLNDGESINLKEGEKMDIFSFVIKINKPTIPNVKWVDGTPINSVNFKNKLFTALDSNGNSIKYNLREQKNYFPIRMCTIKNPFDFIPDAEIDEFDLKELLKYFGTKDTRYDVNQTAGSAGRIDLLDVLDTMAEIRKQEDLRKQIDAINAQKPNALADARQKRLDD